MVCFLHLICSGTFCCWCRYCYSARFSLSLSTHNNLKKNEKQSKYLQKRGKTRWEFFFPVGICLNKTLSLVCTTKVYLYTRVAAGIPEFSAFNSIARRPKSALRPSVKVHLRCAYHPKNVNIQAWPHY